MFPSSQHFEGKRGVWSYERGTKTNDKQAIIHMDLHKPSNKLIGA